MEQQKYLQRDNDNATENPQRSDSRIRADFENYIKEGHPCVMAQSIIFNNSLTLHSYSGMTSLLSHRKLMDDLKKYIDGYKPHSRNFRSFAAVFSEEMDMSEETFEKKLWHLLNALSNLDEYEWDKSVSSDPTDKCFSFSLNGIAFYIVGLHPNSSRIARRSPYPTIVFNLHAQFEKLRKLGVYQNVRDKIRDNDKAKQGTINPMLDDFGTVSEARQYSGRNVDSDWKCPFHGKK